MIDTALSEETADVAVAPAETDRATIVRVIAASSLGTLFEWYDFYLYGSLALFFGGRFFPPTEPSRRRTPAGKAPRTARPSRTSF